MFLESIKEFFAGKEMVGFITRLLIAIVFLFIGIKIVKIIAKRIFIWYTTFVIKGVFMELAKYQRKNNTT